ncbi:MAG: fused MFS/spermidine synthase [Planctomycetes bacterium]|nr:fused MFS/spermidine synthase [Planctomycetota bacterium]
MATPQDSPPEASEGADSDEAIRPGVLAAWLVLSAVPSACLVAVTNVIATDLGSLPLVWVIPLCLYLLSFVLTFGPKERYPWFIRRFTGEILVFGLVLWAAGGHFTWFAGLGHLVVLTWVCWVAHGELYRARPAPRRLTTFYLCVSLGGWIGGFLVAFVAPRVFTGLWEYPLALGALGLTLLALRRRQILAYVQKAHILQTSASLIVASLALIYLGVDQALSPVRPLAFRNEYGVYKIGTIPLRDENGKRIVVNGKPANMRAMSHGTIIHGKQIVEIPEFPIGYFGPYSPLGVALRLRPSPAKVAIVGLGAGTLGCNLDPRDELTYYELDPDVEVLARKHFTYLELTKATLLPTRTGDARLELSKDPPGTFDVILVDAFSSDSIPIHLLTREAFELYRSRLKPDGWLILHISSRYYDLRPVVRATAASLDPPLVGAIRETVNEDPLELARRFEDASSAYALANDLADLQPLLKNRFVEQSLVKMPTLSPWSDDYANVLGALWAHGQR